MKDKWTIVGLITSVVGAVVSVVASIANRKEQERTIERKVGEAIGRLTKSKEG